MINLKWDYDQIGHAKVYVEYSIHMWIMEVIKKFINILTWTMTFPMWIKTFIEFDVEYDISLVIKNSHRYFEFIYFS
jgi:hypothetical protein